MYIHVSLINIFNLGLVSKVYFLRQSYIKSLSKVCENSQAGENPQLHLGFS